MLKSIICWSAIALLSASVLQAAQQSEVKPASSYRAVLDRYCVACHNEKLKTADLLLDKMDVEKISEGAPVWEKVVKRLRTRAMPPAGAPRPDKSVYDSFVTYLETALDSAAAAKPNPGRPGIHRLNRAEYSNAVRDLLSVELGAEGQSLLPADDSGYGFDNVAEALSISPMLLDRYLSAAGKISRLAIGDTVPDTTTAIYDAPQFLRQDNRISDDLPFWSRGGLAIHHHFALDGDYALKIQLKRNKASNIFGLNEGLTEPHQLEVRVDGQRIKVFTVGGERKGRKRTTNNIAADEADPDIVKYEHTVDQGLEIRFPAKAGTRLVTVSFVRPEEPEGVLKPLALGDVLEQPGGGYKDGEPAVAHVMISGPYDAKGLSETTSRRKIFVCRPTGSADEDLCARRILSTLARRAYRAPVTDEDLKPLTHVFKVGRDTGGFETGIEMALERILVSPQFLFRMELDPANVPPGTAYRVRDIDLASRLSFFLWSSIPDDELLELAERGKLNNREVLQQQVRRMLSDSRSKALVENFAGQWLLVRNVDKIVPDAEIYSGFDDNLREAFKQETNLFFQSMLRDDHGIPDLLNADYTFVNDRLARHYGIPNVYGSNFRRVTLSDENRRGLLTQGSLLTATSYATRTSVVLRGKWLLENVLGTPPPPPPPNVPSLKDRGDDGKVLSVRQQMEQHRASPACATCHARMDPLGIALENFDAIGKWRTTEGAANTPIDSSGTLSDGTKIQGPAGLRKVLLSQSDQFVTTVTEKLLTYALGRTVDYYDEPAVRKIVREAAPTGYRWSSIISGIVNSTPFQMRRSPEP